MGLVTLESALQALDYLEQHNGPGRKHEALKMLEEAEDQSCDAAVAAIAFTLDMQTESPMEFLRCWNQGDFDVIREEWPEAPEEVFIGADLLYKPAERVDERG